MSDRVVVAGTGSGVGKTSVACAVMLGITKAGYTVRPFKVGPDYIDPGYLEAAAGAGAYNLDAWIMGRDGVMDSFLRNSDRDVSVIEGVMGYYDGFDGAGDLASTHQVARMTGSPVVLAVDARGAARSVAATVLGFSKFSPESDIRAVILNNLGSERHEAVCREAVERLGVPVAGAIPRNPGVKFESRHLGLVPAAEDGTVRRAVLGAANFMLDHIDIDMVLDAARSARPLPARPARRVPKSVAKIGVALDGSFNFYYRNNLERLREAGAALEFFSPESGTLPDADGFYIGGGFPEVRGAALEKNPATMKGIADAARGGAPVYAECGGLLYLSKSILHGDEKFRMAGLFDTAAVMTDRATVGYTEGTMHGGPLAGTAPSGFRGHEFHYTRMDGVPPDARFAQSLSMGAGISDGRDGLSAYETVASYGHLHIGADAARNMVDRCRARSRG